MIDLRDVTKRYDDFTALHDVSLHVPAGSLTALLGPSGSGKSTLLRVIAGLEIPDAGRVQIADADATNLPVQRRGIGFVFQHYAAFKHMTVRKNVAFGLEIRDDAQQRRLAAPARPEQGRQRTARNRDRNVVEGGEVTEALRHAADRYRHGVSPFGRDS